jgi:hypothetical protein
VAVGVLIHSLVSDSGYPAVYEVVGAILGLVLGAILGAFYGGALALPRQHD